MVEKPPWPAACGRRASWTLAHSTKTKANGHRVENVECFGKCGTRSAGRRNYLHSPMVHYNKIRWREDHRIASFHFICVSIRVSREVYATAAAAVAPITCATEKEKTWAQPTTTIGKRDLRQSRVIIDANSLLCETVKLDNNETTDIAVVPAAAKHTQMVSIQLIYLRITTK